ncbi:Rrp15p-domain-containing protein [Aspergillus pseudonomiae]|uniref:rRNA processing protein RRP15 n=1 Tax=Aspergillus nomiae NRRL (strain ATCC 15546 / NRRL 13137 / CBS 260.88 / M93) TaxID=1509407 RepID=A0A0L1JAI6_ASPN3|nr:rRNA processing protein RRP15 [Aspergillus nomiae NRRL 13137]KAB8265517.1 Rrp15p-domain-containing protein [Aspergillus pseudonomiae]KNG88732.1 rRNA processing protein RRP15 [Aspergillus nomiae NRRL 13137]
MPLSTTAKKRKVLEGLQGKTGRPQKKFRKQREYHSSSDEAEDDEPTDFKAVSLADSDEDEVEVKKPKKQTKQTKTSIASKNKKDEESSDKDDSDESADSDDKKDEKHDASGSDASSGAEDEDDDYDSDASMPTSTTDHRAVPKRNDPSAFSTSISKILATKLPSSVRADPVLSRSKIATQASTDFADEKLDKQARAKLRAEKQEELDRGRIRDVLGIQRGEAGAVAEEEKRLRKIAQRGVVKLFNAVRAAQVRGEEAAKGERKKGTIGIGEREKAVNEVSKQGFLELISGKKGKPLNIEEA